MERFLALLPELASAHGTDVDRTLVWIHILMAVLFVAWMGFFLYVLIRFRRRRNPRASAGLRGRWSAWAEGGVALAEALLLFGISIPFYSARLGAVAEDPFEIRVVAQQFAWNVHYPGTDGRFGRTDPTLVDETDNPLGLDLDDPHAADDVTAINRFRVPVGRAVRVHLSSKDVIHGFSLPHFRVKRDAIPGLEMAVTFEPTVSTAEMRQRTSDPDFDYEIVCAQLCGLVHYRMRGFVEVLETGALEAWLAEEAALKASEAEADDFWD